MGKILKMAVILAIFCIIAAGGLSLVYLFTMPTIEMNSKLAMENSKREVLGKDGKGVAVSVSPRGYGGPIEMLVGVDPKGKVTGIKVLNQRETPGMGANVINPKFLDQFKGKSTKDPLEAKKDIEAITGATISSRAVCAGVREALKKVKK